MHATVEFAVAVSVFVLNLQKLIKPASRMNFNDDNKNTSGCRRAVSEASDGTI